VEWIDVAEDREKWQAVVNTVMSVRVPQNARNFLARRGTIGFVRRVCSMELVK
jgi:hypothetical protein